MLIYILIRIILFTSGKLCFLLKKELKCDNIIRYMKNFMLEAIKEAQKAADIGEVPVGAVIVKDGQVIGCGHNMTETANDPTRHAEIEAIKQATSAMGYSRLYGCEMYVTCEPCSMCAGAMILARIRKVIIGTDDPKTGACGSVLNLLQDNGLNHQIEIERGIMAEECGKMMTAFFKRLRKSKSEEQIG